MATASCIEMVEDYAVDMDERRRLGKGGMGKVYRATHKDKKGEIAAKKITVEKEYLEQYEKEAELLMNQIPPHENIVKIYDCIKKEYREAGIAMVDIWIMIELCPLGNLAEFAQQNKLSSEKKLDLIYQSALAIQHLHRCKPQSVVHRDVKPENILITGKPSDPTVKLTDFGLSRSVLKEDGLSLAMSTYGGTAGYMAPEQYVLQAGHLAYDKSIDVYSLGLTAQALLDSCKGSAMKAPMFEGKGMGKLMQEKNDTYGSAEKAFEDMPVDKESDNELEKAIKTIIKKMIAFKPTDRPTIEEVVDSLAALRKEVLVAMYGRSVWVREGSEWVKQADYPDDKVWCGMCLCAVPDGIIAMGGREYDWDSKAFRGVSTCYHFSLSTRCWKRLPDMITARQDASAAVLGNVMMVLGGWDSDHNELAVCERINLTDNEWSSAASMLEPLLKPFVASAAGKLFVMSRVSISHPRMQQYNPTTDRFTWAAKVPQYVEVTYEACLVSAADLLYLLRGDQGLAVQYNPATDQWARLSPPLCRYSSMRCGAVMHAGKILLCGGSSDVNWDNMIEQYDEDRNEWDKVDFQMPFKWGIYDSLVGSFCV